MDILNLIPFGREKAIKAPQLVALAGCGSPRQLRRIIHAARSGGAMICSCSDGYFRPETQQETAAFVNRLSRQARSNFAACQSARKSLDVLPGQVTYQDGEEASNA